jgi:hypothetical protein
MREYPLQSVKHALEKGGYAEPLLWLKYRNIQKMISAMMMKRLKR